MVFEPDHELNAILRYMRSVFSGYKIQSHHFVMTALIHAPEIYSGNLCIAGSPFFVLPLHYIN